MFNIKTVNLIQGSSQTDYYGFYIAIKRKINATCSG